ncbi:MAG: serine/threonine protein kinase [Roseibacillus sp.]|nr:serine/threonine protein kinase [Roseibacillus sp.]
MKTIRSFILVSVLTGSLWAVESWPQFRGPGGLATAPEGARIPLVWGDKENLKWKTAMPGPGSSSPVFTGKRLFVTCYTGYGTSREEVGSARDLGRMLVCLDRGDGRVLWKKSIDLANPEDPYRGYLMEHGYASSTPATDGKNVFVFTGKSGLHAFTVEGKLRWSKLVGDRSSNRRWGSAASPVLYRNLVIINAADEARCLIAFDKDSGDEKWRYQSKELELAFGTPQITIAGDGSDELVLSIPHELFALDPATGKRKWLARTRVPGNVSPSVVITDDMICAFGGYPRKMSIGLKRGGSGDVTGNLQWDSKVTTYVPTPLAYGKNLYWVNDSAEAICMDIATGKVMSKRTVAGIERSKRFSFYASMVRVGERLYAVSRHNGTFVFEANPGMKQIAQNRFDDRSDFSGTPALAKDGLYLRSGKFVYSISE